MLAAALAAAGAPKEAVVPAGFPAASAIQSPGVLAGGYLYVSGQSGGSGGDFTAQARQALDKVRTVVEAAGLSLGHVVYTQAYLTDIASAPALDAVYASYFPGRPPARAVLGVAGLPGGSVVINAVAVVEASGVAAVNVGGESRTGYSAGVVTAEGLFLSSIPAQPGPPETRVARALDAFESVAKAAGLGLEHVVFVNPYLTEAISYRELNEAYAKRFEFGNTPARATIFVSSLPAGEITFTGVAARRLEDRQAVRPKNMAPSPTASPCVFAGDAYFCSAKSGFIPGPSSGIYAGDVQGQLRQTMRNLLDGLEEAGLSFGDVVSTTIYLDDLADAEKLDAVYGEYFEAPGPARTVVQQLAPKLASRQPDARGRYGTLEQISLIAVRGAAR